MIEQQVIPSRTRDEGRAEGGAVTHWKMGHSGSWVVAVQVGFFIACCTASLLLSDTPWWCRVVVVQGGGGGA